MRHDYVPTPDGDFAAYLNDFINAITAWWNAQGLNPDDLTELYKAWERWELRYPAHVTAQAAARAAAQAKTQARKDAERELRAVARFVQSFPATTDAQRAALGLTVPRPTRAVPRAPATRPRGVITAVNRLTHELLVTDDATPTRRAHPHGTRGAEVWLKLVPAGEPTPSQPANLTYVTTTSRPTLRTTFTPTDGGKTAVYLLRWINTRGEPGPWSEPVTGTVAA